jgi:hypothetical protein
VRMPHRRACSVPASDRAYLWSPPVAVSSDPASLPSISEIMSDQSHGLIDGGFPIADESFWLVLSPSQAAQVLERPTVRARCN